MESAGPGWANFSGFRDTSIIAYSGFTKKNMNKFCFKFLSQKSAENKDFSVINSNEVIRQSVTMYKPEIENKGLNIC